MLKLVTYAGRRPTNDEIKKQSFLGKSYTYLVATKALERERKDLFQNHQKVKERRIGVFEDVLREWVKQKYKIAGKGEEITLLKRAIAKVAKSDETLAEVLRKDVLTWMDALAKLAVENIDLSQTLPDDLQKYLVNSYVGELLTKLQQAYYDLLEKKQYHLFERAVRNYLCNNFTSFRPIVIMEGFTYLTPLQQFFVEVCYTKNVNVVFLVPSSSNQPKGFERIKITYDKLEEKLKEKYGDSVILERETVKTPPLSQKEDLNHVQTSLFSNMPSVQTYDQKHISLYCYPNRDQEILAAVRTLKEWFNGKYTPDEVAVVVRNRDEFKETLQDFLQATDLKYLDKDGKVCNVIFHDSSRLLLLTPVGRFILTLYDIWDNGTLTINADQFETVLSSGWLGAVLQDSTIQFQILRYQFFNHCKTESDWIKTFENIKQHLDNNHQKNRMPLNLDQTILITCLDHWNQTIQRLKQICQRLFQVENGGISRHIRQLRDEINLLELEIEDIRQSEFDILTKIQDVFEELNKSYSMDLTTKEFGEALHALVKYKEDNEDNFCEKQDHSTIGERLWITTPEGIDGIQRKAIIYVGVDNLRVPSPEPLSWPFYEDQCSKHIANERYMFLTVVRSAQEKLVITSARYDGKHELVESVYMNEVARLLGMKVENLSPEHFYQADFAPTTVESLHRTPQRRTDYSLHELAHYGLCPLRYSLEICSPHAKLYRNDWQLQIYAQGIWLDKIFDALCEYYGPKRKINSKTILSKKFEGAKKHVKGKVKKMFPSFSVSTWYGIEHQVDKQLQYYVNNKGNWKPPFYFFRGKKGSIKILGDNELEERIFFIKYEKPYMMQSGPYSNILFNSIQCTEWLLHGKKQKKVKRENEEDHSLRLFASQYEAVQWWRGIISKDIKSKNTQDSSWKQFKRELEEEKKRMLHWIKGIERNKFPVNAGDHCHTCSARMECLGVNLEVK
ncbi:MAG: hypothetical protein WB502_08905 [Thermoactinomyces sp.]